MQTAPLTLPSHAPLPRCHAGLSLSGTHQASTSTKHTCSRTQAPPPLQLRRAPHGAATAAAGHAAVRTAAKRRRRRQRWWDLCALTEWQWMTCASHSRCQVRARGRVWSGCAVHAWQGALCPQAVRACVHACGQGSECVLRVQRALVCVLVCTYCSHLLWKGRALVPPRVSSTDCRLLWTEWMQVKLVHIVQYLIIQLRYLHYVFNIIGMCLSSNIKLCYYMACSENAVCSERCWTRAHVLKHCWALAHVARPVAHVAHPVQASRTLSCCPAART